MLVSLFNLPLLASHTPHTSYSKDLYGVIGVVRPPTVYLVVAYKAASPIEHSVLLPKPPGAFDPSSQAQACESSKTLVLFLFLNNGPNNSQA